MVFPAAVEVSQVPPPPPREEPAPPTLPSHHPQQDKPPVRASGGGWGTRHTLAVMATFAIALNFMMWTSLSVAIVDMVGSTSTLNNGSLHSDVCEPREDQETSQENLPGDFGWNENTQGLILGSFYYGYAVSHVPLGRLGEVYGGRLTLGLMGALGSLCFLLSPLCAATSTGLFIALRVLQGLIMGGINPVVHSMIPLWFPHDERPRYTTFILTGINLGTVVAMPLTGWLCGTGWMGGWPAPFYVIGTIGLVWSAAWFLLVHSHPEDHPRISQQELHYILSGRSNITEGKVVRVPWVAVVTSPWVWVVMLSGMMDAFSYNTLLMGIPSYLTNIQNFTPSGTGLVSTAPYLMTLVVSSVWGSAVGYFSSSNKLSTRRIRQLSIALGCYIPAVCLGGMCLVRCNAEAAVAVLIVAVGSTSFGYPSYFCSFQDIAPNLAGTLMGLTGTLTSITTALAPSVTGVITNDNQTLGAWRTVFLISAAVYICMATLFIAFTPVRVQPWNFPPTPHHQPDQGSAVSTVGGEREEKGGAASSGR